MDQSIGIEEQVLLQRIARAGGATVGELAGPLREERGWARSTVQKMMDRLVAKGWLGRSKEGGVYRYHSTWTSEEVESEVLRQFVQARFDGSISPLVAYLHGGASLSEAEVTRLRQLIEDWEAGS